MFHASCVRQHAGFLRQLLTKRFMSISAVDGINLEIHCSQLIKPFCKSCTDDMVAADTVPLRTDNQKAGLITRTLILDYDFTDYRFWYIYYYSII